MRSLSPFPRLRAVQWLPKFKVLNINKYEPKQDLSGWLAIYSTTTQATRATKDIITMYLSIMLEQDVLQWHRHLPHYCIDNWDDFYD
jgi:hypothetical protein